MASAPALGKVARMATPPTTKLAAVRACMARGDWAGAIAIAARFPQLGPHRAAILDAHTAYTNPRWIAGLGKDAEALKAEGQRALMQRYPSAE